MQLIGTDLELRRFFQSHCPLAKVGIDITKSKEGCHIKNCTYRPRRGRTKGWDCLFWRGDDRMTNSCGNCKYGECREEYLYPYRCKKEKAVSYSEEKWMDRVHRGYVCEKWDLKKEVTK